MVKTLQALEYVRISQRVDGVDGRGSQDEDVYGGELGKSIQGTTRDLTFRTKSGRSYGYELEANETLALEKQGVQPTDCTAKYEWHIKHDAKIKVTLWVWENSPIP